VGRRLARAGAASTGGSATARSTSPDRASCTRWAAHRARGRIVIGPRIGKYDERQAAGDPGAQHSDVVLGTFILAFGWFGFNPGSTLPGTDLRISFVVVNTMLASIERRARPHVTSATKG
jgi:hypothetical protein